MIEQLCFDTVLFESARDILATMMFMDLEQVSEPGESVEGNTLLGTITFKGKLEGCLAILSDEECGRNIAVSMLGLGPDDEVSAEDIQDAIGEVANMVMGGVKGRLAEHYEELQVSIPSVVRGKDLKSSLGDNDNAGETVLYGLIDGEYGIELRLLYREAG